jgi:peptidoglycan hydrolase-like protein with peptidoglycan-binding domain
MLRLFLVLAFCIGLTTRAVWAQNEEVVWVQIEAQPTLAQASEAARRYSTTLEDVNGFSIGGGWYAIVLGPYSRVDAEQVLRVYRNERTIPRDSFIAFTEGFRQQFWPVGANVLAADPVAAPTAAPATSEAAAPEATPPAAEATPAPETQTLAQDLPDETEREARASEAQLTRAEREALQVALKWAGSYDSTIDGAFGRGTRAAMADWQSANGYGATGVLTTAQRKALLDAYNSILDGLDLGLVRDDTAGIEMLMPKAMVGFTKYEPPFAHYDTKGDIPARVLLISQEGDQATLFGLYDIMQTLAIVPPEGPRSRDNASFVLIGQGADFVSHTEAQLQNGEIKGFTLNWPAGDEERRTRLLGEMQASFTRLPGSLDPSMLSESGQSIDLVAGLKIRKPLLTRSGVFVDGNGAVATVLDAVQGCGRVTIDADTEASVAATDAAAGIAILKPALPMAPRGVAALQAGAPRLQSEVAAAGFSYGDALDRPTLTFGRVADVKGLAGEESVTRLDMEVLAEDLGGPVLDTTGAVIGLLVPAKEGARQLPSNVTYALQSAALKAALAPAGIAPKAASSTEQLAAVDLTTLGEAMTVLVSCWEQ